MCWKWALQSSLESSITPSNLLRVMAWWWNHWVPVRPWSRSLRVPSVLLVIVARNVSTCTFYIQIATHESQPTPECPRVRLSGSRNSLVVWSSNQYTDVINACGCQVAFLSNCVGYVGVVKEEQDWGHWRSLWDSCGYVVGRWPSLWQSHRGWCVAEPSSCRV